MLFRGGRRDADVLLAEFDAVGDGVDDILIAASSCFMSDMLSLEVVDMFLQRQMALYIPQNPGLLFILVRQTVFYVDRGIVE